MVVHFHHHCGRSILSLLGSLYLTLLLTAFRQHLSITQVSIINLNSRGLSARLEHHAQSMSLYHDFKVPHQNIPKQQQQQQDLLIQQQQFQKHPPHPLPGQPQYTTGICLLIKDDNELLPEFIAYHYHAIDLRYLVVGVDPSSTTMPTSILQRFHTLLPDFTYVVWNDTDYMSDWFLQGNYSRIPSFVGPEEFNSTTFQSRFQQTPSLTTTTTTTTTTDGNDDDDDGLSTDNQNSTTKTVDDLLQGINNHRYRQTVFVGECLRHLYQQNRKSKSKKRKDEARNPQNQSQLSPSYLRYMAHIDTDEMLVVNLHFLSVNRGRNDPRFADLTVLAPAATKDDNSNNNETLHQPWLSLEASSVRQLLEAWHHQYPFKRRSCRYLPRILMGSTERQEIPPSPAVFNKSTIVPPIDPSLVPYGFDSKKFESLRFKWHARFNDNPTNGYGKVILDLDELHPRRDTILKPRVRASGIHQITPNLCDKKLPPTSTIWDDRPIATYHYLGSTERHCGKDDPRRTAHKHHKKSIAGSKFPDGPWLDQWLTRFVHIHGLNKSQKLLPEYLLQSSST
jgi:hypothetical protein